MAKGHSRVGGKDVLGEARDPAERSGAQQNSSQDLGDDSRLAHTLENYMEESRDAEDDSLVGAERLR